MYQIFLGVIHSTRGESHRYDLWLFRENSKNHDNESLHLNMIGMKRDIKFPTRAYRERKYIERRQKRSLINAYKGIK